MATHNVRVSSITRYALYAVILGVVTTVYAEKAFGKDIGLLTPEEIEENLQVCMHTS